MRAVYRSVCTMDEQHRRAQKDVAGRSAVEQANPWIGRRLGVYELIEEIGSGGMGKGYLAFRADDAYHKRVAIKISRASIDGTQMIERFRQERQILASLQHPNIVR